MGAFGRDYENPWLVRAMVALGLRCTDRAALAGMAARAAACAEATEGGRRSADLGAALCVLGYRLLEGGGLDAGSAGALLDRLWAYERAVTGAGASASAHAQRWVISNAYLAGQVLLAVGRRGEAREAMRRCGGMDVLVFSPLLAQDDRCVVPRGADRRGDGDLAGAAEDFRRGLECCRGRLGASDWNIVGTTAEPLPFGLVDLQQVVELASRCAQGGVRGCWGIGLGWLGRCSVAGRCPIFGSWASSRQVRWSGCVSSATS